MSVPLIGEALGLRKALISASNRVGNSSPPLIGNTCILEGDDVPITRVAGALIKSQKNKLARHFERQRKRHVHPLHRHRKDHGGKTSLTKIMSTGKLENIFRQPHLYINLYEISDKGSQETGEIFSCMHLYGSGAYWPGQLPREREISGMHRDSSLSNEVP